MLDLPLKQFRSGALLVALLSASVPALSDEALFGVTMPGPSGFLGMSAPIDTVPRYGQFIAQPFSLLNAVSIGEVALAMYGAGDYSYRIQLVTAIGPDAAEMLPLADSTLFFDFSLPTEDHGNPGNLDYVGQWGILPVNQVLPSGNYFLVASTIQPQVPLFAPPLVLGWGGWNGDVHASGQGLASVGLPMVATENPSFAPSTINVEAPYASQFVSANALESLSFLAFAGSANPTSAVPPVFAPVAAVPEPTSGALLICGLALISCIAARPRVSNV